MDKEKIILKWLNKEFGNLTKVVRDDRTFYIDKDRLSLFYYYQDQKNGYIYVNYNRIWLLLESVFSMNHLEISELLKVWLEDTYNLRGVTPAESTSTFKLFVGGYL